MVIQIELEILCKPLPLKFRVHPQSQNFADKI